MDVEQIAHIKTNPVKTVEAARVPRHRLESFILLILLFVRPNNRAKGRAQ